MSSLFGLLKSGYILILGSPRMTGHDGYSRRIEAIDRYLTSKKMIYVFADSELFWGQTSMYQNSPYFQLNGRNPCHHLFFWLLLLRARFIYSHSIYGVSRKLVRIGLNLIRSKIIMDVHGVVPEETLALGQKEMADRLGRIEDWIFQKTDIFVVVTNKMKNHILKKYPGLGKKRFLLLPIVAEYSAPGETQKDPRLAIYSGGAQQWQRVDLLVEAIKSQPEYRYLILTPDTAKFAELLPAKDLPNVQVAYLEGSEYNSILQRAAFGFMLRTEEIINQVACPTKMHDYLSFGIIPIVDFKNIGDFQEMGYVSISIQDFLRLREYSNDFLASARITNQKIAIEISERAKASIEELNRTLDL